MSVVVRGVGVARSADESDPLADPARLRRMDRFARVGFLAGSRALASAGRSKEGAVDGRAGVVFGTAFGCRDSITEHADVVATTRELVELRPAVFAQTVHNAVAGELAIAWKLGGASEVLVSGRTAGLDALIVAARRIEAGAADTMLAGGGEGLNDAMRAAWAAEGDARGDRAEAAEGAAAFLLARNGSGNEGAGLPRLLGGCSFFEPHAKDAAFRLQDWAGAFLHGTTSVRLFLSPAWAEPEFAESLAKVPGFERPVAASNASELFAGAGAVDAVAALEALRGDGDAALVAVRDGDGATAAVVFRR